MSGGADDEVAKAMLGGLMPKKPEPERPAYRWQGNSRGYYGGSTGGRSFDDYGNYIGPRRFDDAVGDDLDDLFPETKRPVSTVTRMPTQSASASASAPWWIRQNMESLKACVDRMGGGKRPITKMEGQSLATYLMLMFGDMAEKAGDLIWTTKGKETIRRGIVEALDDFCVYRGGVHTKITTGEEVTKPGFTGPVAEQILIDALASQGVDKDEVGLSVLDYLREHGVRLMAEEDIQEEGIRAAPTKAATSPKEDVSVVAHVEQDPVSEGNSDDDDEGGFMTGPIG